MFTANDAIATNQEHVEAESNLWTRTNCVTWGRSGRGARGRAEKFRILRNEANMSFVYSAPVTEGPAENRGEVLEQPEAQEGRS
jgi:hypothetical protein